MSNYFNTQAFLQAEQTAADHLRWAQAGKKPGSIHQTAQAWQHGIISAWSPQAGLINTIRQAPANTIHASPAPVITCNYFETYVKIKQELGVRKIRGDRVGVLWQWGVTSQSRQAQLGQIKRY